MRVWGDFYLYKSKPQNPRHRLQVQWPGLVRTIRTRGRAKSPDTTPVMLYLQPWYSRRLMKVHRRLRRGQLASRLLKLAIIQFAIRRRRGERTHALPVEAGWEIRTPEQEVIGRGKTEAAAWLAALQDHPDGAPPFRSFVWDGLEIWKGCVKDTRQ